MAANQQAETVKQMLRSFGESARALGTIEGFRIAFEEAASNFRLAEDVETRRVGAGGVPAEWIIPPGADKGCTILYLHGGGYVIGSMRTHREMISRLSRAAGAQALGLEYRLAPENPFPVAVEDTLAAYRWLLAQGIDPKKIVIAGDSAGGGLTLSALVALRYMGEPMPAAGVCLSSWTDMTNTSESFTSKAEVEALVQRELVDFMAQLYLGDRDRQTPLASPLYADLHGLPPLLLQVGSDETLLDDSTRFAERAKADGVDVTLEVWDDMPHVWHLFASILPEGKQAIDRIGEFVRQHTIGNELIAIN